MKQLFIFETKLNKTSIHMKPTLAAAFTTTTLISGYIVDKLLQPFTVIIIGFVFLLIAFTFIGPLPYIPLGMLPENKQAIFLVE